MRLTRKEGASLLGAISAELESVDFKRTRRAEYRHRLPDDTEAHLRSQEDLRSAELRDLRERITSQLSPTPNRKEAV